METHYYKDTDSLYVDLSEAIATDSIEVGPDIVMDLDAGGTVVGIDIQHASKHMEGKYLTSTRFE